MGKKAEDTTRYIIDKVAPIFNKQGYHGTSMKDITMATGLTKGAIYGNFKNKEELAIAAFNSSVRKVTSSINEIMKECDNSIEKLYAITSFYSNYSQKTKGFGGCVILNKGLNTSFQQKALSSRVKEVVSKLTQVIARIIEEGFKPRKAKGSIKEQVKPQQTAGRIYGMLNGGVYMSGILNDQKYLQDIIVQVEKIIKDISA